jgi:hypothetical protein
MMEEKDSELELKKLFKNINIGVSKTSLKKFNVILSKIISKDINKKTDDISDYINIICKHFEINQNMLFTKTRGRIYEAKIICFKILNHTLGFSAQKIATYFKRYPNSITHALNNFKALDINKRQRDKRINADFIECEKLIKNHLLQQ